MLTDIARHGLNEVDELEAAIRLGRCWPVWWGTGLTGLGLSRRAGAAVAAPDLQAVFGRLAHCDCEEPIGTPPRVFSSAERRLSRALAREPDASPGRRQNMARAASQPRKAVAYYSFTFASCSEIDIIYAAMLAAERSADAEAVVQTHTKAVAVAMGWAESHLAVTRERSGSGSVIVPGAGLVCVIAPTLLGSDGAPRLATQVLVLNRTATTSSVLALHGRAIGLVSLGMSVAYDRAVEHGLAQRFGLTWRRVSPGHREMASLRGAFLRQTAEALLRTGDSRRIRTAGSFLAQPARLGEWVAARRGDLQRAATTSVQSQSRRLGALAPRERDARIRRALHSPADHLARGPSRFRSGKLPLGHLMAVADDAIEHVTDYGLDPAALPSWLEGAVRRLASERCDELVVRTAS